MSIELQPLTRTQLPLQSRSGWGIASCHHGEILQGADRDPRTGQQRVLLVTLRTPWVGSEATFEPAEGADLRLDDAEKQRALHAARLTLEMIEREDWGGHLVIRSFTKQARGFGTSTSDCLAAVRATCDAFGVSLRPDAVARILFHAEGASDPLMYQHDVLYRSREGVVHEHFGGLLPPVSFLGFDTDPEGEGVLTHTCPHPSYREDELESFRPLVGALRHAVMNQNPELVGRVATASAKLNQRYLPLNGFEELLEIARTTDSIGIAIAHTGTLGCLLFDPRDPRVEIALDEAEVRLNDAGFARTWRASSPVDERDSPSGQRILPR